jgi:hypothetical protein
VVTRVVRQERGSALWGNGGGRKRRLLAVIALAASVFAFSAGQAQAGGPKRPIVPSDLVAQAVANPQQLFNVIIQANRGTATNKLAEQLSLAQRANPGVARGLYRRFDSIFSGVAATVTGTQLKWLSHCPFVAVITPDMKTTPSSDASNVQIWPDVAQLSAYWPQAAATPGPTIAFLDSGVDAGNPAFGGRVQTQVNFYSGSNPNSPGDGLGHGTFAAVIAAGADDGHTGGVPNAGIVSLDVLDDQGSGSTSDMIAALDWVLQNKAQYNIGVVNISIVASQNSSFMYDPLDKAVEKLWLNGVVVVAAAGNYGSTGGASGVPFAPANDPFVISVGATDTNGTVSTADDFAAPWSAWGATNDGFMKPELAAPGRTCSGLPRRAAARCSGCFPTASSRPATCGCRAPRSPHRSSRPQRRTCSRCTRRGRPTRSRARSCSPRRARTATRPEAHSVSVKCKRRQQQGPPTAPRTRTSA